MKTGPRLKVSSDRLDEPGIKLTNPVYDILLKLLTDAEVMLYLQTLWYYVILIAFCKV